MDLLIKTLIRMGLLKADLDYHVNTLSGVSTAAHVGA